MSSAESANAGDPYNPLADVKKRPPEAGVNPVVYR
jgi:hypothetical protein